MDLRVQKTHNSIINAFLQLRSKKPLEKITVKELAESAMINKATFYLHFKDMYDLSDYMENEIVNNILNSLSEPENILDESGNGVVELFELCSAQNSLIKIIFNGKQTEDFIHRMEKGLRKIVFSKHKEWENDMSRNVLLSFCVCGGYYSFREHGNQNEDKVVGEIAKITAKILKN